jgi:hypothetical protein
VPNDTVTLALDGDIDLADFAEAVRRFNALIRALAKEEQATHVRWLVSDLEVSSTIATARGVSENGMPADVVEGEVERVVSGYLRVGLSLKHGEQIPYSPVVAREAEAITKVLNGRVTTVRFETAEAEATITTLPAARQADLPTPTYGAVEGRVQTLSSRGGLRFTLYDTFHDKAVSCYLVEGYEDVMRDAWGRRAVVEGRVTRDPVTGRPLAARGITRIEILPEVKPGSYRDLRGISPSPGLSPEEAIRRLRDAG